MLAQRLKALRQERDILQKDMAKIMKISPSAYGYYEQGKRKPDPEQLAFLAEYFDVSVDYLLGLTDLKERDYTLSFHTVSVDGLDDDEIAAVKNMIEMLKKKNK